jgi:glucosamine--fructose-6-phosphate aminotransferase (isomerizing)
MNYGLARIRLDVAQTIVQGLQRLEYRGYDSAGLAVDGLDDTISIFKEVGPVVNLLGLVKEQLADQSGLLLNHAGMGHTRWATHGAVHVRNCHPHVSSGENEFVVIHNGIITNYKEIKTMLEKHKYEFTSETDTEVLAKLCLYFYRELSAAQEMFDLKSIVLRVSGLIQGASAFLVKSKLFPHELCAFKRGSPLIMGIKSVHVDDVHMEIPVTFAGEPEGSLEKSGSRNSSSSHFANEYYVASDINAIVEHTRRVLYLEDEDVVHFDANGRFHFYRPEERGLSDSSGIRKPTTLESELSVSSKGNFDHYMLKEIFEQEESVLNTMRGRINLNTGVVTLGGLRSQIDGINRCRRLVFIACGTSYHAVVATRQLVEELTSLPVSVEVASDFLDRSTPIFRDDTCFFISQSGETADTLQALEYCKARGALCVGITNTVGSVIARLTDCGVHLNAGPEVGVASTKCYTSQIIAIILIAMQLSQDRVSTQQKRLNISEGLSQLSSVVHATLSLSKRIQSLASQIKEAKTLLLLGRGYQFASCLEGALKIKEIAYIHTEGLNSGELKHGPLALVDPNTPIIMICTKDSLYTKAHSALQQVLARQGRPIVFCSQGDEDIKSLVPDAIEVPSIIDCLQPIVNIIPLQLLAYHLAILKGYDVDRPRNLAKSVTVRE